MTTQPGRNGGTLVRPEKGDILNPKGRPPKLLTAITRELREGGFDRVSKAEIIEAIELLLNLPEDQIRELTTDKGAPLFLRIITKQLLSQRGFEALQVILDRAHGKPTQQVTANVITEKPIFTAIDLSPE